MKTESGERKAFFSRRAFIGLGAAVAAGGGIAAGWFGAGLVEYMGASPDTPWKALAPDEAATVERLAEELIPADSFAPGAKETKVARFIDWQLAPGAAYERHLPEYRKHLAAIGDMSAAEVEKRLPDFFNMLLAHVKLGFYGSPAHGGNADWASNRMIGIAGWTVTGRNIPGKENHL